jgi:hypothetical protein
MTQLKKRNPHNDEVTIPGVTAREDLLTYLVPAHPTPSWNDPVAIQVEVNATNGKHFQSRQNQFIILRLHHADLQGEPLPEPMDRKIGINDLLYLNRLIAEIAQQQAIAQEKAIRMIANNPDPGENHDDDDQQSIPISRLVQCERLPYDVSVPKNLFQCTRLSGVFQERIFAWLERMESPNELGD